MTTKLDKLLKTMIYPMTKDLHIVSAKYGKDTEIFHYDLYSGELRTKNFRAFSGAQVIVHNSSLTTVQTYRDGFVHSYNGNPTYVNLCLNRTINRKDVVNWQQYFWDDTNVYKFPNTQVYENLVLTESSYFIFDKTVNAKCYLDFCNSSGIDLNNVTEQDIELIRMKFA